MHKALRVMALMLLIVVGTATGAYAGSASSGWDRFASWGNGGNQHCGGYQASVYTPPSVLNAYGSVRHRIGDPCDNNDNAPAGWLGVKEYLQNGNGVVCVSAGWEYNSSSAFLISRNTGGTNGTCDNWQTVRGVALGRLWNDNQNQYETANSWIHSPYQN